MNMIISENTKAILLLTAPLLLGKSSEQYDLLKPKEYHQLALYLREIKKQPADLLSIEAGDILKKYTQLDKERILKLLSRGFLLAQVINYWQMRGIWVMSRADEFYPNRLKSRLKEHSPAILYGCGNLKLLDQGGLAVVGSRNIDNELTIYSQEIGKLSAQAGKMIISGGAKGVDNAAMYSALKFGGSVCGVLSDSLEKMALHIDNRKALQEGRLVLISACDPKSGFNTGNAMQRNKYIYALSDAALIVNADEKKGGTWAGAIEQLDKYQHIPIYIRSTGRSSEGLNALKTKGALLWNNPNNIQNFNEIFNCSMSNGSNDKEPKQISFLDDSPELLEDSNITSNIQLDKCSDFKQENNSTVNKKPDDLLFEYLSQLIKNLTTNSYKKDTELADALDVSISQMRVWLKRLVDNKVMIKKNRPVKYIWKE